MTLNNAQLLYLAGVASGFWVGVFTCFVLTSYCKWKPLKKRCDDHAVTADYDLEALERCAKLNPLGGLDEQR